jgi:hypothetical protein
MVGKICEKKNEAISKVMPKRKFEFLKSESFFCRSSAELFCKQYVC